MNGLVRFPIGWSRNRPARFQSASGLDQVLVEAPLQSFQAAPLRLGQVGGESEGTHVGQNLAEARKPPFQLGGARRQDR